MKKWYQSCGWVLAAVLALQFSGCTSTSSFLSRKQSKADDQKLAAADGKSKKDGSAKKPDSKSKPLDSQLAQKSGKPKSAPDKAVDELTAKDASGKNKKTSTGKVSNDPFPFDGRESEDVADTTAKKPARKAVSAKTTAKAGSGLDIDDEVSLTSADGKRGPVSPANANSSSGKDEPDWFGGKTETEPSKSKKVDASSSIDDILGEDFDTDKSEPSAAKTPTKPEKKAAGRPGALAKLCPDAEGEVRELLTSLSENDVEGLKRGIHQIGRMGTVARSAAPALTHLLSHQNSIVRIHAALALARIQASRPETVQIVVEGLKSKDPAIRSFAATVLAELGPQVSDALVVLADSLQDHDGYVRLNAAEVLIRYEQYQNKALDTLLAALQDRDDRLRWLATYSLAELAPESQETVDALVKASNDRVLMVQLGAVYAIGEIGPFAKSAGVHLRKLADKTQHPELQQQIMYVLQEIEQ